MKKIYMSVGALLLSATLVIGQNNIQNLPTKAKLGDFDKTPVIKNTSNHNNKAPGDIIWSEDFSGGFPAGWTTGGTTNSGTDWVINNAPISATYTNTTGIASTSAGNHMLYFGETITPVGDRDAYFETTAIALTGQTSVTVRFEQKFRLCCASSAELNLVVSTDPSFPATSATQTFDVRSAVAINAQSADPLVSAINITSLVGGYTGNMYMRFHWASGASHYYWMIDDIAVIESVDNDLTQYNEYYGTFFIPYTRIPVDQIQPIDFAMETTNVGATDQTNTILTADVNGGSVFTGTSAPGTVTAMTVGGTVAAASDSLFTTTQWTPPTTTGVAYTIDLTVSSDSVDNTPANNTVTFEPLEVSQYIYAMDDYGATVTPGNGGGYDGQTTPPLEEFEAGNFYDIFVNAQVYAIDLVIGTDADIGSAIDVVLYDWTTGTAVQVDRSNPYVVVNGDLGTTKTIILPTFPSLVAGNTYFAAVHSFGGGSEFFYGTSGSSPDGSGAAAQTSLISYPDMVNGTQNYYTSRTPMIRMNFDPGVIGVDEFDANNINFNVYPNPSAGEFNINLTSTEAYDAELTVKNVVGQTIINKIVAVAGKTIETISLSDYSKGIYFLTINNETVKLIVE